MRCAASDRRRVRRLACSVPLVIMLAAALPAPVGAQSASLAEQLCSAAPGRQAAAPFPQEAALVAAAGAAERAISGLRGSGDPSAADRVPLAAPSVSPAPPAAAAVARYCAAAGEAMRLGANGSQAQAVNYLLTAYRKAEEAGLDDVAALAAYRLALVGGEQGSGTGTRGGALSTTAEAEAASTAAASACAELRDVRLATVTLPYLSVLALECAADRSLVIGDPRLAALANLKLSRVEAGLAETPGADRALLLGSARARIARALPAALSLIPDQGRTTLVTRLVETALELGEGPSPLLASAVRRLGEGAGPEAAPAAAGLEGRLALARGDSASARAHFQAAILAESRRTLPERLPIHYLGLADADPQRRSEHVRAAYAALENLRPLLPRFDPVTEESVFSLHMRDVFIAAVQDRLDGAALDGGSESGRIREAQTIVEAFRQAELQSAFGSECLPPRQAARPEDLLPGEILLYPLLLDDRLELVYVVGGEASGAAPTYRRLPPNRDAGRADVARLVEDVVLAMSAGGDGWRAPARRLHELLIAPIADRLGPDSMLAIVPDGPLRALPFAALVAPDGRYLVQQTRLSLIPALAYSAPEGARGERLSVVAASLQRQMALPVGFFPELAGTAAEAQVAVRFADRGRFIPDFTRADLESALDGGRIDVLHLATHATFNGRSDRAFIVANGEVIRLSELRELIGRTRTRGEPLDLIVLSACETAVGDDEASMGLAGAAVQAGARSVIGSLWQVSDTGTAELMAQFYSRYSSGRSRSDALRGAQVALIEAGGDTSNPNIWAAFALLGAWR